MAQFTDGHRRSMDAQDIFSRSDDLAATLESERKHREQISRMWATGAVIGTILLPRLIYEIPGVKHTIDSTFNWVHDKMPWNNENSGSSGEGQTIDTTPDTETPTDNNPSSTHGGGTDTTANPSVPDLTAEQWRGLMIMDMKNTGGEYPWTKAVNYFGSKAEADQWLHSAVTKAGAHWHGSGTDAYIQLANGSTDTATVWEALINAQPVPR
jgi:hypothetical protein